jgi:hypothetical protein
MTGRNVIASLIARAKPWALAFAVLGVTTFVNFSLQTWMATRAPFLPYFPRWS